MSGEFDITTGVSQEDVLVPALFNLFSNAVIAVTIFSHPYANKKMLHNLEDSLVVGRKKMREEVNSIKRDQMA